MKKILSTILLGASTIFATKASAQVAIAAWTFPASSADAIIDSGDLTLNSGRFISCQYGTQGLSSYYIIPIDYTQDGSLVPSVPNDKCGAVTALNNCADSAYWMIKFKTTGYNNVKLYSKQWASLTPPGPRDFKIQYRLTGGIVWNDLDSVVCANDWTSGVVNGLVLPTDCNNQSLNVSIRWLMSSNTDISGGSLSATGISKIDDIIITGIPTTGIANTDTRIPVSIYPNPNNGNFIINNTGSIKNIKIYDMVGRCVYTVNNTSDCKLPISGLINGVYIMNITTTDEEQVSYKFVVE